MAETPYMTKVKVINNFHEFSEIDKDGNTEVPTHLVQAYASVGTIEMPTGFDKKQAAKEAK